MLINMKFKATPQGPVEFPVSFLFNRGLGSAFGLAQTCFPAWKDVDIVVDKEVDIGYIRYSNSCRSWHRKVIQPFEAAI